MGCWSVLKWLECNYFRYLVWCGYVDWYEGLVIEYFVVIFIDYFGDVKL